jgi:hypothetical protein
MCFPTKILPVIPSPPPICSAPVVALVDSMFEFTTNDFTEKRPLHANVPSSGMTRFLDTTLPYNVETKALSSTVIDCAFMFPVMPKSLEIALFPYTTKFWPT